MTLTIELADEKAAVLRSKAEAMGLTLDALVRQVAEAEAEVPPAPRESFAHLQTTDPDEWLRRVDAHRAAHKERLPVLSDWAISRDSIYEDDAL